MGLKDAATGKELARSGDQILWCIPVLMAAIVIFGLLRLVWQSLPALFGLVAIVGGGISAYLMMRERARTSDSQGLLSAHWTVWYWLAMVASCGIVAAAFAFYARAARRQPS